MQTLSPRAAGAARVRQEGPIDLATAASMFPRGNQWDRVSPASLRRWIIAGKAGVRLDGAQVKGELRTSIAAMSRFAAALAARANG